MGHWTVNYTGNQGQFNNHDILFVGSKTCIWNSLSLSYPLQSLNRITTIFTLNHLYLQQIQTTVLCILTDYLLTIRLKEVRPEELPDRFFCRDDLDESKAAANGPGGDEYYRKLARETNTGCEGLDGTFMQNIFERSASRLVKRWKLYFLSLILY